MKAVNIEHWEQYKEFCALKYPIGKELVWRMEKFAETLEEKIEDLEDYKTWDESIIKLAATEREFSDNFILANIVKDLKDAWQHGEQLRLWFNKIYNYDGPGVANPHYNGHVRDMAPPPEECKGKQVHQVLKAMVPYNPFTGEIGSFFLNYCEEKRFDSIYFDPKNDILYVTIGGVTKSSGIYEYLLMKDEDEAKTL